MPVIELIGALAGVYMGATAWAHPLNNFNEAFAHRVDNGRSCFSRIAGEPGSYGKPSNYDLDLICNWRLKKVTKTGTYDEWELTRG